MLVLRCRIEFYTHNGAESLHCENVCTNSDRMCFETRKSTFDQKIIWNLNPILIQCNTDTKLKLIFAIIGTPHKSAALVMWTTLAS